MIIKGTKKQNLVNDKSESHHSDQVIIAQKQNQNVFMGNGAGISALKNADNRNKLVNKPPNTVQKSSLSCYQSKSKIVVANETRSAT